MTNMNIFKMFMLLPIIVIILYLASIMYKQQQTLGKEAQGKLELVAKPVDQKQLTLKLLLTYLKLTSETSPT